MGRPTEGVKVRIKRGWAYAHFTWGGRHFRIALFLRGDSREAQEAASRAYAQVIHGERRPVQRRAGRLFDLAGLLGQWVDFKRPTLSPEMAETIEGYGRRFVDFFGSLSEITKASAAEYCHARLGQAMRTTVLRERAYLVQFLEWAEMQGALSHVPTVLRLPPKAAGKRTGRQRSKPVHISEAEAKRILALLPEESKTIGGRKWPIRDRFAFAWETGLRPATLSRFRVPDHWSPGMKHIEIAAMIDKGRWERQVDVTPAAARILARWAPKEAGLVFGGSCYYKALKRAAATVLGPVRGRDFAPYDFRHGRAKDWLDDGATIRGVGYQLGQKRASTTDKYLAPDRQAGKAALGKPKGRGRRS